MNTDKKPRPSAALRTALVMFGVALTAFLTAGAAYAVDDGTLGIRPEKESDFFHLSVYPGSALDATAIVTNHTSEPVTLLTYPVDGQSTPQGTFALAAEADERKGVGAWVQLESGSITVPAKSEQKVPFRISVPVGTEPGDYAGGLIIQSPPVKGETSMVDGDTALRLDVIQRQGVRIYLDVAGEAVKSLDHGSLDWKRDGDTLTFTLPVHNTGNVTLHPAADLDVSEWTGTDTKLTFNKPESILPGASLDLQATLQDAPPVHIGQAQANLTSEAGTATAATSILHVSLLVIGIALLSLAVIVLTAWRIIRFIQRAREAMAKVAQTELEPTDPGTRRANRQRTGASR